MKEMEFVDSIPVFYPSLAGILDSSCNWSSNPVRVDLFTSTGDSTGIYALADESGEYWIEGARLATLDSSTQYYMASMLSNNIQFVSSTDHWYNLAYSSPIVFSCASIPLGDKSNIELGTIKLFPNPANNVLNIEALPKSWYISLSDATGKIYKRLKGSQASLTINTADLASGLYLIQITNLSNNQHDVRKIIIE
jgi:hypothetical protein